MKTIHFASNLILALSLFACKKQADEIVQFPDTVINAPYDAGKLITWDQLPNEFKNATPMDVTKETNVSGTDRKSTRLNSSHERLSRMPSSA